jgi:hypothetical protein
MSWSLILGGSFIVELAVYAIVLASYWRRRKP